MLLQLLQNVRHILDVDSRRKNDAALTWLDFLCFRSDYKFGIEVSNDASICFHFCLTQRRPIKILILEEASTPKEP